MNTTHLARTISRLASPQPGQDFAVDLAADGLRTALASLFESAGATLLAQDSALVAPAGIVDLELPPAPLVPARVKALIDRVAPGGTIVVTIHSGVDNPQHAAQLWGPCFDMHRVHGERDGDAVVLRGVRRLPLERGRRRALRQIAHALPATVLIGREGLSHSLVAAAQDALQRHGIVKVKQTPMCKLPKEEVVSDLVWATGSQLVSRIGRVSVIYRGDVELAPPKRQKG